MKEKLGVLLYLYGTGNPYDIVCGELYPAAQAQLAAQATSFKLSFKLVFCNILNFGPIICYFIHPKAKVITLLNLSDKCLLKWPPIKRFICHSNTILTKDCY